MNDCKTRKFVMSHMMLRILAVVLALGLWIGAAGLGHWLGVGCMEMKWQCSHDWREHR